MRRMLNHLMHNNRRRGILISGKNDLGYFTVSELPITRKLLWDFRLASVRRNVRRSSVHGDVSRQRVRIFNERAQNKYAIFFLTFLRIKCKTDSGIASVGKAQDCTNLKLLPAA